MKDEKPTGLALMREPFPANQISTLPKGGVKLSYVGHAALTDRLLDADPMWTWEPVPAPETLGLPTAPGGMWIKLTVCGVTRYGYGDAGTKKGGDAVKEIIGDALRNAAMRFGAALDLWHKGDLHGTDEAEPEAKAATAPEGYAAFVLDLQAAAKKGTAALKTEWLESAIEHRAHMTATDAKGWEAMKADAAKVDAGTVAA
jgi:hypothetical protein